MTNIVAMPIYGKIHKQILTLKRGMQDRVLEFYQVC